MQATPSTPADSSRAPAPAMDEEEIRSLVAAFEKHNFSDDAEFRVSGRRRRGLVVGTGLGARSGGDWIPGSDHVVAIAVVEGGPARGPVAPAVRPQRERNARRWV